MAFISRHDPPIKPRGDVEERSGSETREDHYTRRVYLGRAWASYLTSSRRKGKSSSLQRVTDFTPGSISRRQEESKRAFGAMMSVFFWWEMGRGKDVGSHFCISVFRYSIVSDKKASRLILLSACVSIVCRVKFYQTEF